MNNINLELRKGEVLVLVGENGAGKSTLVKILSGIYTADEGGSLELKLGYNYSKPKKDAEVVATICGDPFIAVGKYGKGKSAVVSTDCSSHWAPPEFCEWKHYNTLVKNLLDFLTEE